MGMAIHSFPCYNIDSYDKKGEGIWVKQKTLPLLTGVTSMKE